MVLRKTDGLPTAASTAAEHHTAIADVCHCYTPRLGNTRGCRHGLDAQDNTRGPTEPSVYRLRCEKRGIGRQQQLRQDLGGTRATWHKGQRGLQEALDFRRHGCAVAPVPVHDAAKRGTTTRVRERRVLIIFWFAIRGAASNR